MDLQPLKIERAEPARKVRARHRRGWIGPLVTVAVVGGLLWLFRAPILAFVDSLRLPEVTTLRVVKSNPAAAASAVGTSSNGYIVAKTRAALSADTPGRIVKLNVEEGSVVKKGDVVAQLYSDEYAALLRRAEADLELAKAGLDRARAEHKVSDDDLLRLRSVQNSSAADLSQQEATLLLAELDFQRAARLLDQGVGTIERRDRAKGELDAAQARVTSAKAQVDTSALATKQGESQVAVSAVAEKEAQARVDMMTATREQAKATLDKTEVRAPFDGIVVLKDAEVGEVVSPNVQGGSNARGSVVTMVDFDSLEVQAEVPETSLSAVGIGRTAKIYLDAFPDKPYPGRVDRIWPTANRTKATVEVRVAFLARDDKLRPEMGVRVVFEDEGAPGSSSSPEGDAQPVLLIPLEAVVKTSGENGVFVLERDRVRLRKIALGAERAGRTIVQSGLADGETIVVAPPRSLEDGDRVRVKG